MEKLVVRPKHVVNVVWQQLHCGEVIRRKSGAEEHLNVFWCKRLNDSCVG